jgi:plasmid stabilization system protein ParE
MAKEVVITQLAIEDYEHVTQYLTAKWGMNVANNFIDRFNEVLVLLSKNPGIYIFVDRVKKMQKCPLTKHNALYFIETEDMVKIVTIFDTRQDPEKLTRII